MRLRKRVAHRPTSELSELVAPARRGRRGLARRPRRRRAPWGELLSAATPRGAPRTTPEGAPLTRAHGQAIRRQLGKRAMAPKINGRDLVAPPMVHVGTKHRALEEAFRSAAQELDDAERKAAEFVKESTRKGKARRGCRARPKPSSPPPASRPRTSSPRPRPPPPRRPRLPGTRGSIGRTRSQVEDDRTFHGGIQVACETQRGRYQV